MTSKTLDIRRWNTFISRSRWEHHNSTLSTALTGFAKRSVVNSHFVHTRGSDWKKYVIFQVLTMKISGLRALPQQNLHNLTLTLTLTKISIYGQTNVCGDVFQSNWAVLFGHQSEIRSTWTPTTRDAPLPFLKLCPKSAETGRKPSQLEGIRRRPFSRSEFSPSLIGGRSLYGTDMDLQNTAVINDSVGHRNPGLRCNNVWYHCTNIR